MKHFLVLDIATSGVSDVRAFLDPADTRKAPASYKKPESIAEWQQEDFDKDVERAGLDLDLSRITGFAYVGQDFTGKPEEGVMLCRDDTAEHQALVKLSGLIKDRTLVGFNLFYFDAPLLMRRARYRNVSFPVINCDKYRSQHVDVMAHLSMNDPSRRKSLSWYVRRMGWSDLSKPLSGSEEAKVPQTGRWDELEASMKHDVEATYRLAAWAGLL